MEVNQNYEYLSIKETERLRIRPLTLVDIPVWIDFIMSEETTEFFPDNFKLHPSYAQLWIEGQLNRYSQHKFGLMALVDKNTDLLVGQCGLLQQVVNEVEEIEIGYHLLPKYWGLGYATEAAQKFKEIGFENYHFKSIVSLIHKENIQSQNVAVRNGMIKTDKTLHKGLNAFVFRVKREEFIQQKLID